MIVLAYCKICCLLYLLKKHKQTRRDVDLKWCAKDISTERYDYSVYALLVLNMFCENKSYFLLLQLSPLSKL